MRKILPKFIKTPEKCVGLRGWSALKRAKYFTVTSLKDLFYHVNAHVTVDFIKDIGFYNRL